MPLGAQILGGLLKKKPEVPEFIPVNAAEEQARAIAGNVGNFGAASALTEQTNQFSQDQLLKALRQAIPNYDRIVSGATGNIASMIEGKLPEDVEKAIYRSGAGKALAGGYGGSGAARNLVARDLGLNSLQVTQQGLNSAMQWLQNAKAVSVAPQMNVSSMFLTPEQQIAVTESNRTGQFQRDYVANQLEAQYDPMTTIGNAILTSDAQMAQIAASFAGGAGGMMMGCWVARAVYGEADGRWLLFRAWLQEEGPGWLRVLYQRFGPTWAKWVARYPRLKAMVRRWMDARIAGRNH